MSKIKDAIKKRKAGIAVGLVTAILFSAAGGVGGYMYGSKGEKTQEAVETVENQERSFITIEEDAAGNILINGEEYKPNSVALGEGRIFMEKVPTNCRETETALKASMRQGEIAAKLNPDQRFEFELLNILAKDVCSYESYRNMLTSGLADFLYAAPASVAEAGEPGAEGAEQAGSAEGDAAGTNPDEAGDPPVTTPGNK